MKYLVYSGTQVLTSDAAADATLAYCALLGERGRTDVVAVPTADLFGAADSVSIVLGPSVPLMSTTAPDDVLESDDDEFVQALALRAAALREGAHQYH